MGGLTVEKILALLCNMRRGRIHLFDADFVVFLQEIILEPGKAQLEKDDIQISAGKQAEEWRGTAIAHTSSLRHSQTKLLQCGMACTLQWGEQRFVGLSGHLPHHATILQAGVILNSWSTQLSRSHRAVVGWDANETFSDLDFRPW